MGLTCKIKEFKVREDGSLLVFFVVCIVAVLGILSLSFDMGRRASTQTDMQSFADNVALAAAGELDGQADSITRAVAAAQNAINAANETLKVGASGTNATLSFDPDAVGAADDMVFYTALPATDTPSSFAYQDLSDPTHADYKYALPTANVTTVGTEAVLVGVRLNLVDVDWMFANIFGSANLPDEAVGAVAVAGNTAWTCDISPVMFCVPNDASGDPVTLSEGQAINLQDGDFWSPGQFGWLDLTGIAASAGSNCAGLTPESREQACLLAEGINACYNSRRVDVQTGIRGGQESAAFNLHFGVGGQSMRNLVQRDPVTYGAGPHNVTGQDFNGGCTNSTNNAETMPFPLDDCHAVGNCPAGRIGNGTWTVGHAEYVETNYEIPGHPVASHADGTYFDFPGGAGLTRYEYYLLEIERAANGGDMPGLLAETGDSKYGVDADQTGGVAAYNSWDDYWPNSTPGGVNPIIPPDHYTGAIVDNGLPQCNIDPTATSDRRVIIAAGINCDPNGDGEYDDYTGTVPADVPVEEYYRVFILAPARDIPGPEGRSELHVEIIESIGGEAGASVVDNGIFRETVQLFK